MVNLCQSNIIIFVLLGLVALFLFLSMGKGKKEYFTEAATGVLPATVTNIDFVPNAKDMVEPRYGYAPWTGTIQPQP